MASAVSGVVPRGTVEERLFVDGSGSSHGGICAVRKRFPGASEEDFKRELIRWLYGDEAAAMVSRLDYPEVKTALS